MAKFKREKMLELYIHDYLVKKKMHATANILAREAGIQAQPYGPAINTPEGFLSEWWSVFWDAYSSSLLRNNPQAEQATNSEVNLNVSQNHGGDVGSTLRNICPPMPGPGIPDLLQDVDPAPIPSPEMGSSLQNDFREMMDFLENWFGKTSTDDSMTQERMMTGAGGSLPRRNLDAADSNVLNDDNQFADTLLMTSSSGSQKKKARGKRWRRVANIERNAKTEKPLDEGIACFFTNDEAFDNMNISSTHTLAQNRSEQGAFPFGPVITMHPSDDILSCCDFSAEGKFLVAAGHEKKVFVWNWRQASTYSFKEHTQPITDIRFKPNSDIFATSSFDKTVKIWDAVNRKRKSLSTLVGHADLVNSVDFQPRKTNLLCSCDCNDEIRLWNTEDSTCSRSFKGGNRKVRFQSRQGNLLAAATGNVINLIDVETSTIQSRFEGHEKDVLTICWDACGQHLVSTSEDCTCVWSISAGGKCIHKLLSSDGEFASSTFHPVHSEVVAVGANRYVYIWNPIMGNKLWKFPGHKGVISSMANAPENKMIASVSHDMTLNIWK